MQNANIVTCHGVIHYLKHKNYQILCMFWCIHWNEITFSKIEVFRMFPIFSNKIPSLLCSIDGSVVECSPATLIAERGRPGFDSQSMHFFLILLFIKSKLKDRRYRPIGTQVPILAQLCVAFVSVGNRRQFNLIHDKTRFSNMMSATTLKKERNDWRYTTGILRRPQGSVL